MKFLTRLIDLVTETRRSRKASDKTRRARPSVEALEERLVPVQPTTAAGLLPQFFPGQVQTVRQLGPQATANDFYNAGQRTVASALNRGGLGAIGQRNLLQANDFVFRSGLADAGIRRTPDGFNPLTMYTGTRYDVYQAVNQDISTRYSPTGTLNMDYLGILSDRNYGLTTLPQTARLPATRSVVLNLGVVQNGTSFLARRPDGSQARPSDYNLPYTSSGVFNPSAVSYGNVYNNPWNSSSSSRVATPSYSTPSYGGTWSTPSYRAPSYGSSWSTPSYFGGRYR